MNRTCAWPRAARTAAAADKAKVELRLYQSRVRFRELGC